MREALHAITDLVDQDEREAPERRGFILHRRLGPTFTTVLEEEAWRVSGRSAERAEFADLSVLERAAMAAKRLTCLGVDDALQKEGAVEGDEVQISDLAFELTIDHSEGEWSLVQPSPITVVLSLKSTWCRARRR